MLNSKTKNKTHTTHFKQVVIAQGTVHVYSVSETTVSLGGRTKPNHNWKVNLKSRKLTICKLKMSEQC